MSPSKMETGFILAGGKGLRMRKLGQLLPKCSLVAYDQPLLVRQVETCRMHGIEEVYVSINPESEHIVRAILQAVSDKISIHYLIDQEQEGPVSALIAAGSRIRDRGTLFFLGDIYLENDDFALHAKTHAADALILDTQRQTDMDLIMAGCNVVAEGDVITEIREKPTRDQVLEEMCWTGVSYLPPSFFSHMDALEEQGKINGLAHIGDLYRLALQEGLAINYFEETGAVINLTTPEDLLLMNCLEFRKISRTTTDMKSEVLARITEIFSEP